MAVQSLEVKHLVKDKNVGLVSVWVIISNSSCDYRDVIDRAKRVEKRVIHDVGTCPKGTSVTI